jgi:hypothetical protein
MDGPIAGATVFACLFSSALAGVIVHARLPGHSLRLGARVVMQRGVTIIAAMAGVLLVMLTLSQKASFDHANREVKEFSAQLIQLDHTLRRAGPAADHARELLFRYAVHAMQQVWPAGSLAIRPPDSATPPPLGQLEDAIAALAQTTPAQRDIVTEAQRILHAASQTDWALDASQGGSTSPWLLAVVLFWLMLTFASFGLSAPLGGHGGGTLVITTLFLGAIALGGAMFLLEEYNDPFHGIITVSHEPLQAALFAISE